MYFLITFFFSGVALDANSFLRLSEHSCRPTWEYPTSDLEADCQLFPEAISTSLRSSTFTGLTGYPKFSEESFSILGLRNTKLTSFAFAGTIGFGFAIGESSLVVANLTSFWHGALLRSSERKSLKWLQENTEKLIILNKRRRWFHSSCVKLSLVSMSASWFLVSTNLIWILGSRHVSHRWTSSFGNHFDDVSSKMYNWDSPWEECAFVVTLFTSDNWSIFFLLLSHLNHYVPKIKRENSIHA